MRRVKRVEKRQPGEFRLLKRLGVEINLVRFRKHMARLERSMHADLAYRRIKIKSRRRFAANKAAFPA